MNDFQLSQDGGGVGCQNHFGKVVDDNLVTAIWAQRCLHCLSDRSAGINLELVSGVEARD